MCLCSKAGGDLYMPRGHEMCGHYKAPPSSTNPALYCMRRLQAQCCSMGIPMWTRHRHVAPNQYEFASLFGTVTMQIDQLVVTMQTIEEVAAPHGMVTLLQEKPFVNVKGSGEHYFWPIGSLDGVNLLNVDQTVMAYGSSDISPVIMSALVAAVDTHGDLMRIAIASPGNDIRLGACEAPPAIVSTYLGEDVTTFLDGYRKGSDAPYKHSERDLDHGFPCIPPLSMLPKIATKKDGDKEHPFVNGADVAVFHYYICKSTGDYTAQEKAELHVMDSCKKVLISAPHMEAMKAMKAVKAVKAMKTLKAMNAVKAKFAVKETAKKQKNKKKKR